LLLVNEWVKVRTLPFVFAFEFDNFIDVGSTFVVDVGALLCGCVVVLAGFGDELQMPDAHNG
jgi:hypothetical protein